MKKKLLTNLGSATTFWYKIKRATQFDGTDPTNWDKLKKHLSLNSNKMNLTRRCFLGEKSSRLSDSHQRNGYTDETK